MKEQKIKIILGLSNGLKGCSLQKNPNALHSDSFSCHKLLMCFSLSLSLIVSLTLSLVSLSRLSLSLLSLSLLSLSLILSLSLFLSAHPKFYETTIKECNVNNVKKGRKESLYKSKSFSLLKQLIVI